MNLKRILTGLMGVVADEASRNPEFRERLEKILGNGTSSSKGWAAKDDKGEKRKGGRRAPAVLDPVDLAAQGEQQLRSRLVELDLERLLDIVAQYGMDPGKLVMKWKDKQRIIDRIVEVSSGRATKGDAFRKD